jgi:TM2 domain-containing membrane protein YozV
MGVGMGVGGKSKMAAGLLGIFLGWLGVHNFYLGYTSKAVIQLVVSILGILTSCLIIGAFAIMGMGIWGLIEGIFILTGKIDRDAQGVPLSE